MDDGAQVTGSKIALPKLTKEGCRGMVEWWREGERGLAVPSKTVVGPVNRYDNRQSANWVNWNVRQSQWGKSNNKWIRPFCRCKCEAFYSVSISLSSSPSLYLSLWLRLEWTDECQPREKIKWKAIPLDHCFCSALRVICKGFIVKCLRCISLLSGILKIFYI